MAEDITSKRQEIIDASVAAFKSLIINKYNNQTLSNITVASKKWWSTAGNASSLTWACCKEDTTSDTGASLEQTTYNINRNTYWKTSAGGIFPTVGYGNPVYYNSVRYILYAGELTRSSRLDDNGNIVIEYDAVWYMGASRLLADGTYDMREGDPNTEQQTGGWTVPIPNLFYDSWIRPGVECWDGACNSTEDTKKPCGILCSSLHPVEKTEPVYCTPAFEESYTIGNFTMDPVVAPDVPDIPVDPDDPDNPDDPDTPVDPDDPDNPGDDTQIEYVTLGTNQVILTDESIINTGAKVICEFALDIDSTANYSPRLAYPIITCPVGYQESGCDVGDLYLYSTPQSLQVAVGYSNADLYDSILSIVGPTSCTTNSKTQNTSLALTGDHTVELDLQSTAGDSSVKLDSYNLALDHLNGTLSANATRPRVLAIGGYVCGNAGVVRYDCVGERKIYAVRVEGGSSDGTVELLPVVDSSGREGLRNTKTGHIAYPITAVGYGNYYVADYIILNANKGVKLNAQISSSSVVTITFKVPEENIPDHPGIGMPLLSLQGTVDGKLTTIDISVFAYLVELQGTTYSSTSINQTLFNDVTGPRGIGFGESGFRYIDSRWHTYTIDFNKGNILLDGKVVDENFHYIIKDFSSLKWDRPSSGNYPILAGEIRSNDFGITSAGYVVISKVEVRDAYRTELDFDEGLAADLSVAYYLPALNRNYVACLMSSPIDGYVSGGNTLYAEYSIPGYSIRDAGLYRLPGDS